MVTEGKVKKLTLGQWEEKYISGPVARFDQKYMMFHRTVRWFTDNTRWADSFYIWADNLFGYDRPVKAEDF